MADQVQTLQGSDEAKVLPAAALNVYVLGGRSKGSLFFCDGSKPFANLFALQLGIGTDGVNPAGLLGLALEPVSGVSFGGGLALHVEQVLNADAVDGMVLPNPAVLPLHDQAILSPYFSVSLNSTILDVLLKQRTSLQGKRIQ